MARAKQTKWSDVPGGRAGFMQRHHAIALVSALGQARLQATLDRLGPPGQWRGDPFLGELEMRGRTFQAEQLGSFDGNSWLWAWANKHLNIPDAKTTLARSLRDRAAELGAVLAVPELHVADEALPYLFGAFAVGHTPAEAYYIANQSQVYLFLPGQLARPTASPIEELRDAIAAVESAGMVANVAPAIAPAAKQLGLAVTTGTRDIVIGEGRESISVPITSDGTALRTLGLCFVSKSVTIDDVATHLRQTRDMSEMKFTKVDGATLELDQHGCTIRVTRSDRLRDVMSAAKRTGNDDAKKFGAVLAVATATTPEFQGPTCAIGVGRTWMPTSMVAGEVVGPVYPFAAIATCERLNASGAIKDSFVYDCALGTPYPR